MAAMDPAELRAFLEAGTRTGKLGCLTPNGHPHVMPIWFALDDDPSVECGFQVVFTTPARSVKGKHVLSDGRVSLAVDDATPPYAFVHIRGRARALAGAVDLLDWATRIGGRYMGTDRADEYGARNAVPDELLVRLSPERVISERAVAG